MFFAMRKKKIKNEKESDCFYEWGVALVADVKRIKNFRNKIKIDRSLWEDKLAKDRNEQ